MRATVVRWNNFLHLVSLSSIYWVRLNFCCEKKNVLRYYRVEESGRSSRCACVQGVAVQASPTTPPPGTHHYENICVTSTLQLNNRTKTTQPVEHIYSKTRKCMQCAMEARSCNHLLQGKSNQCYIFWVCVCSLRYPVCNAHAPYCHLRAARSTIFSHVIS